jgi:hypothetical protein
MRPRKSGKPAYDLLVFERHRELDAKGSRAYREAVADAARKLIPAPIESADVFVEIFYSTQAGAPQADIVEIIKPTLEALKGIAFLDETQIQSVTASVFDPSQHLTPSRGGAQLGPFLVSAVRHALLIRIFSESALRLAGSSKGRKAVARWLRGAPKRGSAKIRGNERSKVLRS